MTSKASLCLLVALVVVIGSPVNAAGPQTGKKCTKLGVSSIAAGKKYSCIKPRNTLVWSKGVPIAKATTPSPPAPIKVISGPIPGDAPLRREGCGIGTFYYRLNGAIMERSFFEDEGFTKSDPRSEDSFHVIRVKAFNAVRENFKSSQAKLVEIQSHVSPTFPQDLLIVLQNQLELNVAFWHEYFPKGSKVQATYFTGDDQSYSDNSKQTMSAPVEQFFVDELRRFKRYNCSLINGVSGAHLVGKGPYSGQAGIWFGASSPPQKTLWAPWYQPHELTHSVQALIVKDLYPFDLPLNFLEGGAEFFGQAMAYQNLAWYSDEVDKRIIEKDMNEFIMPIKSAADVIKMLEITESNSGPVAGGATVPNAMRWSYSMGNLLWEWVTAEYGYEAYWKILKAFNTNRSYEQSLKAVLGITKSQMYEAASPYILSQMTRALSSNWKEKWQTR